MSTSRAVALTLLAALLTPGLPAGATVPAGFTDNLVATVASPTQIAFTPDGRLLITTQPGQLRVYQNGALLPTPALNLASVICSGFERGLLGVVPDPSFATNGYIYLYYSFKKSGSCPPNDPINSPPNRVSRFTLPPSNVIDPLSEVVLVDNIPAPNGNHNAGDLHFGPDGKLYVSVGDGGCSLTSSSSCGGANDNSRRLDILSGKILRVNPDGTVPPDNPLAGASGARRCGDPAGVPAGTGPCAEMYLWGLRNPFRFAFQPGTSTFYVNDVGQNVWEEIDLSVAGADYGWNVREGGCANGSTSDCGAPPAGMTNPIYSYRHSITVPGTTSSGCNSITGGAFVPSGVWPPAYQGLYLFSDYVCGSIFKLVPSGPTFGAQDFATGLGSSSAVEMAFGPFGATQSLYYTTYAGGGQVRRIDDTSTAQNQDPTASMTANPTSGNAPLLVSFDGSASSDPDVGDTLTYHWVFGDGGTQTTAGPTTSHTYAVGSYTAQLTVEDDHGATSAPVTKQISSGNTAPVPVITVPAAGATFTVGQNVSLTGTASDAQDGALPASALSWTVLLHHDVHTHPFLGPVSGNGIALTAPAPEDLLAATNSYLEVRLTATDSDGTPATVTRSFLPAKVNVTFATVPAGLALTVNGTALTGPQTVVSWVGYVLNAAAAAQTFQSTPYVFGSWSDGGAASHAITTPAAAATYTATFTVAPPPGLALHTVAPCRVLDTRDPDGPYGGPAIPGGATRSFTVSGRCGIPAGATSVVSNLTVVSPPAGGNFRVFPQGAVPPSTSTLNWGPGLIRANNAILALSQAGGISVQCDMPSVPPGAHLILDVVGYFQ